MMWTEKSVRIPMSTTTLPTPGSLQGGNRKEEAGGGSAEGISSGFHPAADAYAGGISLKMALTPETAGTG